jgi:hypothetical protein
LTILKVEGRTWSQWLKWLFAYKIHLWCVAAEDASPNELQITLLSYCICKFYSPKSHKRGNEHISVNIMDIFPWTARVVYWEMGQRWFILYFFERNRRGQAPYWLILLKKGEIQKKYEKNRKLKERGNYNKDQKNQTNYTGFIQTSIADILSSRTLCRSKENSDKNLLLQFCTWGSMLLNIQSFLVVQTLQVINIITSMGKKAHIAFPWSVWRFGKLVLWWWQRPQLSSNRLWQNCISGISVPVSSFLRRHR